MNLLLLVQSARLLPVRDRIRFDSNVFCPFLYRNNLECCDVCSVKKHRASFREGDGTGKNTQRWPKVSCAVQENFIKVRECLRPRGSHSSPRWFLQCSWVVLYAVVPVNISCVMGTMPEWETVSLLAEAFVFLTRFSCAKPGNENDFNKPLKLWELFWFQLRKAFAQSMCNLQYLYSNFA